MKRKQPKRPNGRSSASTVLTADEIAAAIDVVVATAKRRGVPPAIVGDAFSTAILKIYGPHGARPENRRARLISAFVDNLRAASELLPQVDAEVIAAGRRIFSSDGAVGIWLCTPAIFAAGKRPIELLRTRQGKEKVLKVLMGLEYGNVT
jgi:hypothetical protein